MWYVVRNQQRFGPFSAQQLRTFAAQGKLQTEDLLCQNGSSDMKQAGKLLWLFPECPTKLDQVQPVLVPIEDDDSDIFAGQPENDEDAGPLSLKGYKIRPTHNLTLGDFQIIKKLGAGAMGAVYLAHQRSAQRPVAIKVLSKELADSPVYLHRFYREASILSHFDHPNIVRYLGNGEREGIPFIAMEYVDGCTTHSLLRRLGGRIPVADAIHIIMCCAEALKYGHSRNIVHRDVKPSNIMLTRDGQVKLADLGLAKPINDRDQDVTESGVTAGTPTYMSPEQSRNAKHANQRSDIYALGGVLYHFVTGVPPFRGETAMELLLAKEQGMFRSARKQNNDISPHLDLIIDKMLAKDVRYRYQSCDEFLRDLVQLNLATSTFTFDKRVLSSETTSSNGDGFHENLVEVLLVEDRTEDIRLTQRALEQKKIPSNVIAVNNGDEALDFLRRNGPYHLARTPNLIIIGSDVRHPATLAVLRELRDREDLQSIPVVILSRSGDSADYLELLGIPVSLSLSKPDDVPKFDYLLQSIQGLYLTVVETPSVKEANL